MRGQITGWPMRVRGAAALVLSIDIIWAVDSRLRVDR